MANDPKKDLTTDSKPTLSEWFSKYGLMASIVLAAVIIGIAVSVGAVLVAISYFYNAHQIKTASQNQTGNNVQITDSKPVDLQLKADAPVLGDPNAKVTLVEYADFQCPFCYKFFETVLPQLRSKYIDTGKAKFVFQNFAFLGEESSYAAEAAKCANEQGKFWEYHDLLYQNQKAENSGAFSLANLKKLGKQLNMDNVVFDKCIDSRKNKVAVEEEVLAAERSGVNATPTLFVNGQKIEALKPFAHYSGLIDAALK